MHMYASILLLLMYMHLLSLPLHACIYKPNIYLCHIYMPSCLYALPFCLSSAISPAMPVTYALSFLHNIYCLPLFSAILLCSHVTMKEGKRRWEGRMGTDIDSELGHISLTQCFLCATGNHAADKYYYY